MLLRDEHRLPQHLVMRALHEMEEDGVIHTDTAALLIEMGADMCRLEKQVEDQARNMERV